MAITGGIKFFEPSKCLFADGTFISATSGNSAAARMIDRNPITYWTSVDSTDLVTETIIILMPEAVTIDRILLVDHNWKEFTVKYYSGATYVNFSGVVGLDGSKANISETTFADDTAYYEFTPVSTTQIEITVTKTQTANQQKYINAFIATEELGTFQGYPMINVLTHNRNAQSRTTLGGKVLVQKSEESFLCKLLFENYPASLSADIDLLFELYDREINFIMWICGGKRGSTYFKKQMKGYRLKDVYTVNTPEPVTPLYTANVYQNPVNFFQTFVEAVD